MGKTQLKACLNVTLFIFDKQAARPLRLNFVSFAVCFDDDDYWDHWTVMLLFLFFWAMGASFHCIQSAHRVRSVWPHSATDRAIAMEEEFLATDQAPHCPSWWCTKHLHSAAALSWTGFEGVIFSNLSPPPPQYGAVYHRHPSSRLEFKNNIVCWLEWSLTPRIYRMRNVRFRMKVK